MDNFSRSYNNPVVMSYVNIDVFCPVASFYPNPGPRVNNNNIIIIYKPRVHASCTCTKTNAQLSAVAVVANSEIRRK